MFPINLFVYFTPHSLPLPPSHPSQDPSPHLPHFSERVEPRPPSILHPGHQVFAGLGAPSPTEARQGSPVREQIP